jgi:hypothetical protein
METEADSRIDNPAGHPIANGKCRMQNSNITTRDGLIKWGLSPASFRALWRTAMTEPLSMHPFFMKGNMTKENQKQNTTGNPHFAEALELFGKLTTAVTLAGMGKFPVGPVNMLVKIALVFLKDDLIQHAADGKDLTEALGMARQANNELKAVMEKMILG